MNLLYTYGIRNLKAHPSGSCMQGRGFSSTPCLCGSNGKEIEGELTAGMIEHVKARFGTKSINESTSIVAGPWGINIIHT